MATVIGFAGVLVVARPGAQVPVIGVLLVLARRCVQQRVSNAHARRHGVRGHARVLRRQYAADVGRPCGRMIMTAAALVVVRRLVRGQECDDVGRICRNGRARGAGHLPIRASSAGGCDGDCTLMRYAAPAFSALCRCGLPCGARRCGVWWEWWSSDLRAALTSGEAVGRGVPGRTASPSRCATPNMQAMGSKAPDMQVPSARSGRGQDRRDHWGDRSLGSTHRTTVQQMRAHSGTGFPVSRITPGTIAASREDGLGPSNNHGNFWPRT